MPVFVSLLRGVNVGGHNQIKMAALRGICEDIGFERVQTYVQSGNVVFWSKQADPAAAGSRLRKAIGKNAGFEPDIVTRTRTDLEGVINCNPFAGRHDVPPDRLITTFFERLAQPETIAKVNALKVEPEEFAMIGRELYVFYPEGMGRSKFPAAAISKIVKEQGTARNWNTVLKLFEMAGEVEHPTMGK